MHASRNGSMVRVAFAVSLVLAAIQPAASMIRTTDSVNNTQSYPSVPSSLGRVYPPHQRLSARLMQADCNDTTTTTTTISPLEDKEDPVALLVDSSCGANRAVQVAKDLLYPSSLFEQEAHFLILGSPCASASCLDDIGPLNLTVSVPPNLGILSVLSSTFDELSMFLKKETNRTEPSSEVVEVLIELDYTTPESNSGETDPIEDSQDTRVKEIVLAVLGVTVFALLLWSVIAWREYRRRLYRDACIQEEIADRVRQPRRLTPPPSHWIQEERSTRNRGVSDNEEEEDDENAWRAISWFGIDFGDSMDEAVRDEVINRLMTAERRERMVLEFLEGMGVPEPALPALTDTQVNHLVASSLEDSPRSTDNEGVVSSCAICLDDCDPANDASSRLDVALPCDHRFHVDCIRPWLTRMSAFCPQCRRHVLEDERQCASHQQG